MDYDVDGKFQWESESLESALETALWDIGLKGILKLLLSICEDKPVPPSYWIKVLREALDVL